MRTTTWKGLAVALAMLFLATACQENIYHGVSETAANEMIVVLEQHGIEANKQPDPNAEGGWVVSVPSGVKVEAWRVLQAQGLPRDDVKGFDAFYPSGGLIPTTSEERVLLQYSTAQELRKTLLKVDGIVSAAVNLVLPEKPKVQLESTVIEPPRASVLIKFRPEADKPPVSEEQVRKLVAGGVEGLEAQNVSVVFTRAVRAGQPLAEAKFDTVGPVSVAPRSKSMLQILVAAMGICIVLLSGGVVYLLLRMRKDS